jgi:hypothetical protein
MLNFYVDFEVIEIFLKERLLKKVWKKVYSTECVFSDFPFTFFLRVCLKFRQEQFFKTITTTLNQHKTEFFNT